MKVGKHRMREVVGMSGFAAQHACVPASVSRNVGIDLLRGLAIVLVIFNHIGIRIPLKKTELVDLLPARFLSDLNYNGYEAVFVFFVISGFLITDNALRRWGDLARIDMKTFYALRFSRIVPCLLLLVALLSVLHELGVQDYVIDRPGQSLPRAVLAALGLHLNWYEGMTGYLPGNWDVLWSLSIEEVFYIGFPIVCLLTRRVWILAPLLVLLAVSMPWTHAALTDNEIWQEKAYLPGMSAIAIGVIGALLARRWPVLSVMQARVLIVVGALGMIAEMFGGRFLWPLIGDSILLLLTLSAMLVLIALQASPVSRVRGFGWLASWGRLSYEIYLSHMFVVYGVVHIYKTMGSDVTLGFLWYFLALPLCWVLGRAVQRYVSQPSERWLRARLITAKSSIRLAQANESA
jgi:peptidoglycan/LPS O-acetylase OafA/YrhL